MLQSKRKSLIGFSLLELLVAVAIIATLVLLGNAALSQARSASRSVACIQNLRSVGVAFQGYAGDHQQTIYLNIEKIGTSVQWLRYLIGLTDGQNNRGSDGIIYLSNPSSGVCPAFTPYTFNGKPVDVVGLSYGDSPRDNADPASTPLSDGKAASRVVRLPMIASPSTYWLVADSYSTSLNKQFYALGTTDTSRGLHFRHSGRANILFADGHVEGVTLKQFSQFPLYSRRHGFDEKQNLITAE